jgi:hypothetical protein
LCANHVGGLFSPKQCRLWTWCWRRRWKHIVRNTNIEFFSLLCFGHLC